MALAERVPFRDGRIGASGLGGASAGVDELLDFLARCRPAWHAQAACRGRTDLSWFPGATDDAGAAVAVCGGCPVAVQCRQAAEAKDEKAGIWAGVERGRRARTRDDGRRPGPVDRRVRTERCSTGRSG